MLFLDGEPNVRDLDEIVKPVNVRQIFETQHKMELEARAYYDKAARECQQAGDSGTFDLFVSILKEEEGHIDFLEDQFNPLELMGNQYYIGRQVWSFFHTSRTTRTTSAPVATCQFGLRSKTSPGKYLASRISAVRAWASIPSRREMRADAAATPREASRVMRWVVTTFMNLCTESPPVYRAAPFVGRM